MNNISKQDEELRADVNFYLSHLSVNELIIIKELARGLCVINSQTYNQWYAEANNDAIPRLQR